MRLEDIILKPIVTEKTSTITDRYNNYTFAVILKANKNQVKQAVEKCYGVKVASIRTSIRPGKLKRIGRTVKKEGKTKRAMVQLVEGQKIKLFEGV